MKFSPFDRIRSEKKFLFENFGSKKVDGDLVQLRYRSKLFSTTTIYLNEVEIAKIKTVYKWKNLLRFKYPVLFVDVDSGDVYSAKFKDYTQIECKDKLVFILFSRYRFEILANSKYCGTGKLTFPRAWFSSDSYWEIDLEGDYTDRELIQFCSAIIINDLYLTNDS